MIRTLPTVVKLRSATAKIVVRPGEVAECKLVLDRTSLLKGPIEVNMTAIDGLQAGKVRFEENQTEAVVNIRLDGKSRSLTVDTLTFRATGRLESGATVVSEVLVPIALGK